MPAAPAAAQLRADHRDDLDAFLTQQCDTAGVAVVGEDHARRCADESGAAVPLCALAHVSGAAGLDDTHLLHSERIGHGLYERLLVLAQLDSARVVRRPIRER